MPDNADTPQSGRRAVNWKKNLAVCLLIFLLGVGLTVLIFSTEPTAVRTGATKETAMLVEAIKAERGTFHPTISATGTVEPARDIILSPRVGGQIIERSSGFTPGGFVNEGETLLQIDPADYRNTLRQRESELRQAIADLNIEMGRQNIAQKDYQLLNESLSPENEALVLRKPQLNTARAMVENARAAVEQARLALQRTTVKAPFNAHVLSRNANVGSQVSPGDNLGRLVGVDTYWVAATVPLAKLRWLQFPETPETVGSTVRIHNHTAWPTDQFRSGHLYSLVGALEEQTRMARVLISVEDPLVRQSVSGAKPALMIGTFVEVNIQAKAIPDVLRLKRDYVRKKDTVWVMRNGLLKIRKVDIVFRDAQYAYIRRGISEDEPVITTNLTTVVDGARLRLKAADAAAAKDRQTGDQAEERVGVKFSEAVAQ